MVNKTKKYARRALRVKKRYGRRHRDKRFPFSAAVGLGVSVLAPPIPGWTNVLDAVKTGQYEKAFQSFVASWTGIQLGGIGGQTNTEFNAMKALNPLDFTYAPAWKAMLVTSLVAKITKKFVGDPLARIPIIGKYVKYA